jgi:hypothetical protein
MKKHKSVITSMNVVLSKKEVEYLSSLVEAQVSRLLILNPKERAKQPFKEEYQVFNKLGGKLSVTA